jgi:hypothetical protein
MTFQDAVNAVKSFNSANQPVLKSWPAFLGNEDGSVQGSSSEYVYVRYPSSTSPAVEVYNGGVPLTANLRVMVGYRAEQPELLQALGVADVRVEGSTPIYGGMKPHGSQHSWFYSDPVYVLFRQIMNLGVFISSGLIIRIMPGMLKTSTGYIWIADQTFDLTTHLPTSGARYVVISISDAGVVTATDGSDVADLSLLTTADIPTVPTSHFRLAAIRLVAGQTTIHDTYTSSDITDLRFPQVAASLPIFTAGSIPYADTSGNLTEDNTRLYWDTTYYQIRRGLANLSAVATSMGFPGIVNVNNANDGSALVSIAIGAGRPSVAGIKINGTAASPTAVLLGEVLMRVSGRGWGSTVFATAPRARIDMTAWEDWTDSAQGTEIQFWTTKNGTTTTAQSLTVTDDGNTRTYGRRQPCGLYSGDHTLTVNEEVVIFSAAATATLPVASGNWQTYRIINESVASNVIIDGAGSDTIKGALTLTLYPGDSITITNYDSGKWA